MAEGRPRGGESRKRGAGAGRAKPGSSARGGAPRDARGGPKAAGKGAPRAAKGAARRVKPTSKSGTFDRSSRSAKPAARGAKPVARGGKPAARSAKPVARGGKPATRGAKPVARGGKPATRGGPAPSSSARTGPPDARGAKPDARGGKPVRGRPPADRRPRITDVRPSGASWRPDRSRSAAAEPKLERAPAPRERTASNAGPPSQLRIVRGGKAAAKPAAKPAKAKGTRRRIGPGPARTGAALRARGPAPGAVRDEILRFGGSRGPKLYAQLVRAGDAYAADRERDALRILRPLRAAVPQSVGVRELLGLALYRSGRFPEAIEELEEYVARANAVDQHPALMDCYRAERKWKKVEALWDELAATSAAPAVMTEGRIVLAGSLADRGRLREAVRLLERRAGDVKRVEEHHLRLWYALADLQERAGNLPRARALFERISRDDPAFADVGERLAALG